MYPDHDTIFEEYMQHPTMSRSRHEDKLAQSTGLLELHYDNMRKRQMERQQAACHIKPPTMNRPFNATVGYGGFIPGKGEGNLVGCTHGRGSQLAKESRPLPPCGSGLLFTIGRAQSLPSLKASETSLPAAQKNLQELGYASPPRRSHRDALDL